jgi:hypothetical protein
VRLTGHGSTLLSLSPLPARSFSGQVIHRVAHGAAVQNFVDGITALYLHMMCKRG